MSLYTYEYVYIHVMISTDLEKNLYCFRQIHVCERLNLGKVTCCSVYSGV